MIETTFAVNDCGCSIIARERITGLSPTYYTITHCPLHKSADDMYEALKAVLATVICNDGMSISYAIDGKTRKLIDKALSLAEGR